MKFLGLTVLLMAAFVENSWSQHQYIVYSSIGQSGISSNLVKYDTTTGETFLLTGFAETDTGIIQSISFDASGGFVYFTRESPFNGREKSAIWRVSIDGGGLTDFLSPDTSISYTYVAVSPDGNTVCYTANDDGNPDAYHLYICNADGSNIRRLTSDPTWVCSYPVFVNNTTVLFKMKQGFLEDYYTVTLTGNLVNLTHNEGFSPYFPRLGRPMISPNRDTIIYAKQVQQPTGYTDWALYQFSPLDDTGTEILLTDSLYFVETDPLNQEEPYPAYADNTDTILFCGSVTGNVYDLYSVNIPIINPYFLMLTHGGFHISLPFYLTVAPHPQNFVYLGQDGFVYLRDASGTSIRLTSVSGNLHPVINRRGSMVAFARNGIYTVRPDGTNLVQIESDSDADYPEFSPDELFVLYKKNNDIYARVIDCSAEPVRLTYTSAVYGDIRFSPTNSEITFTALVNSKKHIFRCPVQISIQNPITITAGAPVDLTPLSGDNYQSCWSSDGKTIAFISTRNQIPELWLMDRDGANQRRVPFSSGAPVNPSNPCFSSDSSNILFYLSKTPKQLYSADISQPQILSLQVTPALNAENFFAGNKPNDYIECERFFSIKERDPKVPFTYFLTMHVDKIPVPNNAVVTEILPDDWVLTDVKINGRTPAQLTSNGETEGILKWLFGTSGLAPLQDSIIQITVDIPDIELYGTMKGLAGWCETVQAKTYTRGLSNIIIADPFISVDTNRDWQISDEELLFTISLWAQTGKISGWPDDISQWDWWLLSVISFWANPAGYTYDSATSQILGTYVWEKI